MSLNCLFPVFFWVGIGFLDVIVVLTVLFRQVGHVTISRKKLSQQYISHNLTMRQCISSETIPNDAENLAGCIT